MCHQIVHLRGGHSMRGEDIGLMQTSAKTIDSDILGACDAFRDRVCVLRLLH